MVDHTNKTLTEEKHLTLACPTCGHTLPSQVSAVWFCPSCNEEFKTVEGIRSLLPRMVDESLRHDYEISAQRTQCSARTVGYVTGGHHRAMVRAFQSLLSPFPVNKLMLDVGCGHGMFSRDWTQQNRVVGVDFALNMLKLARQVGLEVYHADAKALPFADDQFDIVLSAEVIQHFEEITPVLAGMVRVVKPGGSILLSTLNADSIVRRMYRYMRGILPVRHTTAYLPILRKLEQLLRPALDFPIKVEQIALVYFPFNTTKLFSMPNWINRKLASNYAVLFKKVSS